MGPSIPLCFNLQIRFPYFLFFCIQKVAQYMCFFLQALLKSPFGFPGSSAGKESACNIGDPGLFPGSGMSPGEGIGYPLQCPWTSLMAQMVKSLPAMRGPGFDPWVGKIPLRREGLPTPVFSPGEFRGLCSSWDRKSWTRLSDFDFIWNR